MLTEAQKVFWDYYAPLLARERRLTMKVRDSLARYCITQAMVKRLNEDLEALDRVVSFDESGERAHPLVTMLRQYLQISRQYDTDLLLNPAADMRAPVAEEPNKATPADPMAKFARGMKVLKGGRGA
jgi:P27 family predicted phage terminase small subunit